MCLLESRWGVDQCGVKWQCRRSVSLTFSGSAEQLLQGRCSESILSWQYLPPGSFDTSRILVLRLPVCMQTDPHPGLDWWWLYHLPTMGALWRRLRRCRQAEERGGDTTKPIRTPMLMIWGAEMCFPSLTHWCLSVWTENSIHHAILAPGNNCY